MTDKGFNFNVSAKVVDFVNEHNGRYSDPIDLEALLKDLEEIRVIGATLESKCQQTRSKLIEAGVSTPTNLSAIAAQARVNVRSSIFKKQNKKNML